MNPTDRSRDTPKNPNEGSAAGNAKGGADGSIPPDRFLDNVSSADVDSEMEPEEKTP